MKPMDGVSLYPSTMALALATSRGKASRCGPRVLPTATKTIGELRPIVAVSRLPIRCRSTGSVAGCDAQCSHFAMAMGSKRICTCAGATHVPTSVRSCHRIQHKHAKSSHGTLLDATSGTSLRHVLSHARARRAHAFSSKQIVLCVLQNANCSRRDQRGGSAPPRRGHGFAQRALRWPTSPAFLCHRPRSCNEREQRPHDRSAQIRCDVERWGEGHDVPRPLSERCDAGQALG